ncbi:MAG: ABC transporter permease [Lachnospiraceae bacterium]|nr:ABC transporter permease [Lachnospiraceae bacterium]
MMQDKQKRWRYGPSILLALALLMLWQLAAWRADMPHILPGPLQILKRTWELKESLLLHHLPVTLVTILSGWLLSVVLGTSLAMLMHLSEHVEAMLYPALVITQTIPVMCISPLFVLWMGYTMGARLLAVVLSTFFAITLNTFAGLKSASSGSRELLLSYGASRWEMLRQLEIPSALPMFMTGLKMTLPWAVIDAAVAEWLGATQGLGYFSKRMVSKMDGAAVFAPVLVLCVLSLLGMWLIDRVDRKLVYYRNQL